MWSVISRDRNIISTATQHNFTEGMCVWTFRLDHVRLATKCSFAMANQPTNDENGRKIQQQNQQPIINTNKQTFARIHTCKPNHKREKKEKGINKRPAHSVLEQVYFGM